MVHAYRHPIRVFELDDLTMLIGATPSGQLLQLGIVTVDGIELVVHAMPAREQFLR